jgi:hypothetical protein
MGRAIGLDPHRAVRSGVGIAGMMSILAYGAFLALVGWMAMKRSVELVAAFFLMFPFVTRGMDATYVDLVGPVYASELGRYIGGGTSTPMFIYSALAFVLPLLFVFRQTAPVIETCRQRRNWMGYHQTLSRFTLIGAVLILVALYINMARLQSIPLLSGIDRLQYAQDAGILHRGMYELNFLLNFLLGAFTVLPRLNGRDYDLRYAAVFAALLFYWILTGNRFSVFFVQMSFYFMPFAAVLLGRRLGAIGPLGPNSRFQRFLASRTLRLLGALFLTAMLVGLVLNSYYNVRNYRNPVEQIQERILVQPIELWVSAWERIDFAGRAPIYSREALDQVLFNPIDATRNTSIQYLMTTELGYLRSVDLAGLGQQYNGGYPEVDFQIFNPWLTLLVLPLIGLITAWMIRLTISLLYRNMIMSAVLACYVYFGFSLHYIGGFILFLFAPTYVAKIVTLLVVLAWERQFSRPIGAAPALQGHGARAAFRPSAGSGLSRAGPSTT